VSGFVVPTGDVEALADRVRVLAANPRLRETMGERARERILQGFTRDDMLDRVEDLIDGVCSGSAARTARGHAQERSRPHV
jgi:glycosyltransferase involved in cell wall biosynthesis